MELSKDIKWYTKILENEGEFDGLDFTGRLEWGGKDLLDIPFGMAAEIGRENDDPSGKVMWIKMLDGGTLMPTLNADFPVIQQFSTFIIDPVAFPKHAISRQYLNPQSDIRLEGWGMAPPELIYLVFELMKRGDVYYSKLLLDTPQIGILDLGDMSKEDADVWLKEAQDLFVGTDPMKIPVLYQHTTKTEWIPFQMKPNEMMFSEITSRYAGLICAGYGMSLSDIGMGGGSNGGETLSGTIRDERKEKKTIQSVLKKKWRSFYNHILPETLEFTWIDFDVDQNVAKGRALLANSQAYEIFTRNKVFSPHEMRLQALQDGLVTVSVPETLDESSVDWPQSGNTIRPNLIGEKVSADNGGRGEVSSVQASLAVDLLKPIKAVVAKSYQPIQKLIAMTQGMSVEEIQAWKKRVDDALWWRGKSEVEEKPVIPPPPPVDTEKIFERFSDIVDDLGDRLVPQPVNVTVHTHPGEPPVVNVEPPQVNIENQMPEIKQADVHVEVNPTPVTVENTVNVPKQDAPIINIQKEDKEAEKRAYQDALKKINNE